MYKGEKEKNARAKRAKLPFFVGKHTKFVTFLLAPCFLNIPIHGFCDTTLDVDDL